MKLSKLVIYTLIGVIISVAFSFINAYSLGKIHLESATYISTFLIYTSISIFIYISYKQGFNDTPQIIRILFKTWLIWIIFNLIRGAFLAEDYWDIKFLFFTSLPFSLISLTFFLGRNLENVKTIFLFTIKYLFSYGFVLIPLTFLTDPELYSRLMVPVMLFILFIPFIKFRWKILIITVAIISVLWVIEFRSNVIRISFSVLILILYYFQNFISMRLMKLLHLSLFAIPMILFSLAISGKYNIFEANSEKDSYVITNSTGEEEDLSADSRTFLYVEVLKSLHDSGNMILGEGGSGKYQSEYFNDAYFNDGRGRYGCEVGILNILLFNGIIGVMIYFLLLYCVSLIAITQSNNFLVKMLGFYIAFRWTFSFVEEFSNFDLNFYFFWIVIGLISSGSFRKMNNHEIKNYFKLQRTIQ